MLDVLMDGRAHTVAALARTAQIAPSTAVGHVNRLEQGALVVTTREGRQRFVRLAGSSVATAYESLAELSRPVPAKGLRASTRRELLAAARTCYDHLAGRLGVAIAEAARAAGALDEAFLFNASSASWFKQLGVDLDALSPGRKPRVRVCLDWTERREHLGGALGAAICSAAVDSGWVVQRSSSRALAITGHGTDELRRLGILPAPN